MAAPEQNPSKPRRSLFVRISSALVLVLSVLAGVQILTFIYLWPRFLDVTEQTSNASLADELSAQLRTYLAPTVDYTGLYLKLRRLQELNGRLDVYLLKPDGEIAVFVDGLQSLAVSRVPLEPIERFLADGQDRFPIYGVNPRKSRARAVFSAARVPFGGEDGYLYVTLAGKNDPFVLEVVQSHAIPAVVIGTLLMTLLLAGASAVLAIYVLSRRFRSLTAVLERFQAGEYTVRVSDPRGDEIAELGGAFDRMADRVVASMEAVKEQDELRRILVQNISHDLRGPLTSVAGYLETLEERGAALPEAERTEILRVVSDNVGHLRDMIDELFELSKLEARERLPELRSFALDDLAEAVVLKFEPLASERRVTLSLGETASRPVLVRADVSMISRVLSNLVENALRYTRAGGSVEVFLEREAAGGIRVGVADTGIGIPPEDLDRVFSRFYRSDAGRAEHSRGSGLGLAIVEKILELHDAEPVLESEVGVGTTIWFLLPSAGVS